MNNLKGLKANLLKISNDISSLEKSIADITFNASSRGVSLSDDENGENARARYNIACLSYSQQKIETKIKTIEHVSSLRAEHNRRKA